MSAPPAFADYLLAKRSVDDAALNLHVYRRLAAELPPRPAPLRLLEVGCGIGTMAERLREWGLFTGRALAYTAIDSDAASISTAQERVRWPDADLRFAATDLYAFAAAGPPPFDLVVANAVLDLLDLERALPTLRTLIAPGGLGWFTINFDGMTHFEPPIDPPFDAAIEAAYHATMERRRADGQPTGGSRCGSRLLTLLPRHGLPILAAGASDWVVLPLGDGYADGQATFLRWIIETIGGALAGDLTLDPAQLSSWLEARRRQIDAARLCYLAHQFDFLVRAESDAISDRDEA